jgi:hypothetical protein
MKKIILILFLALSLAIPHIALAKDYGSIDAKVNGLTQVVYDSGELATATQTISITGLNGDTDGEYTLIIRQVNDYNGAASLTFSFNNDTTANHYGLQALQAANTSATAVRDGTRSNMIAGNCNAQNEVSFAMHHINSTSGVARTVISKYLYDTATTTVGGIYLSGQVWNNTADELTEIDITSNRTTGLGVGSRVILLRKVDSTSGKKYGAMNIKGQVRNAWQQVYRTELAAPATSVTISGLTGNTDVLYRLRTRVKNSYNGTSNYGLRLNNDSGNNYGYQLIDGNENTIVAARDTSEAQMDIGSTSTQNYLSYIDVLLFAKSGYLRTAIASSIHSISGTTIASLGLFGNVWTNTANEITSIVFLADQTDGLGIGTEIVLERLNLN